jgi:hypothetical protein
LNHLSSVLSGPFLTEQLDHGVPQKIFRVLVTNVGEFIPMRVAAKSAEDVQGFNGWGVGRRNEFKESAQGIEADDIFGVLFGDGVDEVVNVFLCFDGGTE